jgi:murein DD-endopeptidase MepM/ murein hydrolase activator NlpD
MSRYHDDSSRYDAWDDDEYDEYDDDGYDDADESWDDDEPRGLVPYVADAELVQETERSAPTIIPGGWGAMAAPVRGRRRRSLSMQFAVVAVMVCIIVSALFSVGAIGDGSDSANLDPYSLIANAFISSQPKASYHIYYAQPGDTFESIAQLFGVQVNGIFELNNLYLDAQVEVGHGYKIPNDPNYGANYQPKYPPGVNPTGYFAPNSDVLIKSGSASQFSAVAGKTNAPYGPCPAGYAAWNSNPALYQFINFDQPKSGKPVARITQRFWGGHDGIDISTGMLGTPVYAAQAGTVIFAGWDIGGGGWTVKIAHCGYVATSYAHMVPGSLKVKVGQNVVQGQQIGEQGQSGEAFGAHVHFMMWWKNVPIDGLCGYPNGLAGHTIATEANQFNGCPPNLVSTNPFGWG